MYVFIRNCEKWKIQCYILSRNQQNKATQQQKDIVQCLKVENGTFGSLLLVSHVLLLNAADWEGPPPPRGCEVFVGKIPRDMYEDELVPLFERAGKLYEFRLMMEFSGENRGYAFVMYTNK